MALPALGWIIFQVSVRGLPILYEAVVGGSVVAGGTVVAGSRLIGAGARNTAQTSARLGSRAHSGHTSRLTEAFDHGDLSLVHRAGDPADVSAGMGRFVDGRLADEAARSLSNHGAAGYLLRANGAQVQYVRAIGPGSPHGVDDALRAVTAVTANGRAYPGTGMTLNMLSRPNATRGLTSTEADEIRRYLASVGG